ncbi:hypothetical protein EWZ78_03090 [Helicobacter pylori]|nr:hypothetical protein [Helicobacter pylori]NHB03949.1 hypothetical protein [Helicobacter pylori]NHB03992.1 hypothetical protein [Helicobacter pylori]
MNKSYFFQKKGRNGIQSFNHSIIQSFNHSIIQPFNHSIKQSSNQAIKQRYHVFITIFITFTKDRLKIPYFLLFPLLLTLALTLLFPLSLIRATTFLNHLIP